MATRATFRSVSVLRIRPANDPNSYMCRWTCLDLALTFGGESKTGQSIRQAYQLFPKTMTSKSNSMPTGEMTIGLPAKRHCLDRKRTWFAPTGQFELEEPIRSVGIYAHSSRRRQSGDLIKMDVDCSRQIRYTSGFYGNGWRSVDTIRLELAQSKRQAGT
jgi:hypothetical protein